MQQPLAKVAKNWLFIVNFWTFSGLILSMFWTFRHAPQKFQKLILLFNNALHQLLRTFLDFWPSFSFLASFLLCFSFHFCFKFVLCFHVFLNILPLLCAPPDVFDISRLSTINLFMCSDRVSVAINT